MRWTLATLAIVLLAIAAPAVGSFHETVGIIPERVYPLAMQGTSFNAMHAPDAPLLEAAVGEHVRFVIVASESHTFHLHGHPWIVNGTMVDTFLVDPDTPHAFDVFAGGVDHHAGDWMYHCHIDDHMAEGMWGIFRVYPFETQALLAGSIVSVQLDRMGEPLGGAQIALAVDGVEIPAHAEPLGGGRYALHAQLPATGVLVVTATHPEHGVSVARVSLDGSALPAQLVSAHH